MPISAELHSFNAWLESAWQAVQVVKLEALHLYSWADAAYGLDAGLRSVGTVAAAAADADVVLITALLCSSKIRMLGSRPLD